MTEEFDRRIISIHDNEELDVGERILKKSIFATVCQLPLATFHEHKKQNSGANTVDDGDDEDEEDDESNNSDPLTNQSVGGVYRARMLSQQNAADRLPAVYGGLFTVAEYFFRSFDQAKGRFFEKVIAAKDPNKKLDVDRSLVNLLPYLLEANLCWKDLDYTEGKLTKDEEILLSTLDDLTLDLDEDNQGASADATLFLEDQKTLIIGEHRTSVVTGGTTARESLLRKPKGIADELMDPTDVITISEKDAEEIPLGEGSYTFASLLKACNVDEIHAHIGILFNEDRRPAEWVDDRQRNATAVALNNHQKQLNGRLGDRVENLSFDRENLQLRYDVPVGLDDETINVHVSAQYGDTYLNTLYTGSTRAVGCNGSRSMFEDPFCLQEIISNTEADDLWLAFSIAERENKIFEANNNRENNATKIADMILKNESLTAQLVAFRELCRNGVREDIDHELLRLASEVANKYNKIRDNKWAEDAYLDENILEYLRDVALQVLVYDNLSRPIFLRQFPESNAYSDNKDSSASSEISLADIRHTFESYLFQVISDTTKRQNIFRVIRGLTKYEESNAHMPDSSGDGINCKILFKPAEIKYVLNTNSAATIMKNMVEGTDNNKGGILNRKNEQFLVPSRIENHIGDFMCSLKDDEQSRYEEIRPRFLTKFPNPEQPATDYDGERKSEPSLGDVRYTFEEYLFKIGKDTEKKQNIMRIVRNLTKYTNSGTSIPKSETDEIDWEHAPTKEKIGDVMEIRTPTRLLNSMYDGTSNHKGGLLETNGDKYAVPATVAYRMGEAMLEPPDNITLEGVN